MIKIILIHLFSWPRAQVFGWLSSEKFVSNALSPALLMNQQVTFVLLSVLNEASAHSATQAILAFLMAVAVHHVPVQLIDCGRPTRCSIR